MNLGRRPASVPSYTVDERKKGLVEREQIMSGSADLSINFFSLHIIMSVDLSL